MTVLVLGGSGFIGAPLVRRLLARGGAVAVLHRGGSQTPPGAEAVLAHRADVQALKQAVAGRSVRTVVDLLAFTEADILPVIEALSGLIDRYVMVSSGDVYRNYGGLQRLETAEPVLGPMGEDAPLRSRLYPYRKGELRDPGDPDLWMDDYDKIPLEAAARASLPTAIVRAPMVFGPGDKNRRFGWLIRPMAEKRPFILIDEAWARWRTSYGFVDDVAEGIAVAALHPDGAGEVFNVGPAEAPDHLAWAKRFALALGWDGEVRTASAGQAPMSRALAGLDLRFPMRTDTRLIRDRLGYDEPTALEDALARTIEDELARPRPSHLDRQYAAEDAPPNTPTPSPTTSRTSSPSGKSRSSGKVS